MEQDHKPLESCGRDVLERHLRRRLLHTEHRAAELRLDRQRLGGLYQPVPTGDILAGRPDYELHLMRQREHVVRRQQQPRRVLLQPRLLPEHDHDRRLHRLPAQLLLRRRRRANDHVPRYALA